jgi:protein-disulfide isomerase
MGSKRNRRLPLVLGGAALALVVVAATIGVALAATGDGAASGKVQGARKANALFGSIPQTGMTLGDPGAPVEVVEYCDLESTVCKVDAERLLPHLIRTEVATGKAKLTFRNFVIISRQSWDAAAAAVAAGKQGRGWNFAQVFYRNQGRPNSGFATDAFLEAVASAAGVEDLGRWNEARRSAAVRAQVKASTKSAERRGLMGTPTFAVRGPKTHGLELIGTPGGPGPIAKAIAAAG